MYSICNYYCNCTLAEAYSYRTASALARQFTQVWCTMHCCKSTGAQDKMFIGEACAHTVEDVHRGKALVHSRCKMFIVEVLVHRRCSQGRTWCSEGKNAGEASGTECHRKSCFMPKSSLGWYMHHSWVPAISKEEAEAAQSTSEPKASAFWCKCHSSIGAARAS